MSDAVGVDGTATLVESLDSDGATLSERSFPLTGAVVTGLPFSAAGIMINGAEAMSPDSMGLGAMGPDGDADAMSPDGAPDGSPDSPDAMSPDGASAEGGFGTVLPGSGEGNLNFNGPVCYCSGALLYDVSTQSWTTAFHTVSTNCFLSCFDQPRAILFWLRITQLLCSIV